MFVTGFVLLCVSTLLFSLLSIIKDVTIFLILAYNLRLGEGVRGSYYGLPCWPFFSEVFLKTLGWYSVMEATFGVGYTLGPVLRAFLYQAGGQYGPHH